MSSLIEKKILTAVLKHPGSSRTELANLLSLPYTTIKYHLTALHAEGRVIKTYLPGNFRVYRYWVPDATARKGVDCDKCCHSRDFLLTHCSECIHNEDFGDNYSPLPEQELDNER